MKGLRATTLSNADAGSWQIYVYPDGHSRDFPMEQEAPFDVTFFRGAHTTLQEYSATDPFGPATASIVFPKITYFDRLGSGDLWWCVPEANVDIVLAREGENIPSYVWEGYVTSREYGMEAAGANLTLICVGAMRQLDNYLAKPEHLYAPISFEHAILRQFYNRPDLRMPPPTVQWPSWWTNIYQANPAWISKPWLVPTHVREGLPWTGMVTRNTGSFDQVLSGYIQSLLSSMHTPRGQFTLMLDRGRKPVLRHRDYKLAPDDETLVVDLLWPGVELTMTEDYTQHLNVVYTTGKALNGSAYTGMRVANDGTASYYEPFAARRAVHPPTDDNLWLDRTRMRKEVVLSMAEGVPQDEATRIAGAHLARYNDPGITATLVLRTDPLLSDELFPRQAIAAGKSIQLKSLFGDRDGRMFHITACTYSGADNSVSLTLDSKYRDQLTVEEVRMRGRDALTPTRLLTTGAFNPSVPDQPFPWSYEMGAGYIPYGSQALFRDMSNSEAFPWQNWTHAHPPSDPRWTSNYIHIGPRSTEPDHNWNTWETPPNPAPVLLSAEGNARLIEIAAYDANGDVLPVSFHVSLYMSNTVSATAMPALTASDAILVGYEGKADQHHPFFPTAWETISDDGLTLTVWQQSESSASIIVGWGTYYERAGYWPGQFSDPNDSATGLLVDETSFSWSMIGGDVLRVNPQEPTAINVADPNRAMAYLMIYCEDQGAQDVYFLGRIFRAEPGTS